MSTFTPEIRIESAESASVPRCWSIAQICAGQLINFLLEGLAWEKPNFRILMRASSPVGSSRRKDKHVVLATSLGAECARDCATLRGRGPGRLR